MVLRNPPDITIHAPTAFGTFQVEVSATGLVTHNIDITLPLQEQIKRLAQFANNLSRGAAELEKQIAALGRDLKKARADTAELERKTWAHIQSQIQSLDERINSVQVLDLRWAIWGLFISFVGTALSFGT